MYWRKEWRLLGGAMARDGKKGFVCLLWLPVYMQRLDIRVVLTLCCQSYDG